MNGTTERLRTAREAYERQDWHCAYDEFAAADDHGLDPDDLAAYADAAWWLGHTDDAIRLTEAAYRDFLAASRPMEAAKAALDLAVTHILRGDAPVGIGWVGRAAHLVQDIPECPLHGYLLYLTEVEATFGHPDPLTVVRAAERVQELGRRFDDPNLVAAGLNGEGRALLRAGRVEEGMARLDEAMITVLEGELTPDLAGNLYCNTIAACHEVADLTRMARWTQLALQWVSSLPAAVLFGGICRVHQTQLLVLQGEWERAEVEALQVTSDLESISVANVAEAWYVVAECRRRKGDREGAEAAYAETHAHGRDPQPGLALLRLDAGQVDSAATMIRSALSAADPASRHDICAATVEILLEAGRIEDARASAEELAETADRLGTSGLEALATSARGAVALAEGRAEEALPVLRDACRQWYDLGAEYDAARVCVLLARAYAALDDEGSAGRELERAETIFRRLGATPELARLGGSAPGGLTDREVEVLRLVATGLSNRRLAERLYISDRTVARHLSNIFRKLGVESRTQAARYAIDHGLADRPERATH